MMERTEFEFTLPKGLVGMGGDIHRQGMMRLTTAEDEIFVQKDHRVRENSAYGALVLLSRVITNFGSVSVVTPEVLEQLFLIDLIYLRDFFNGLNRLGNQENLGGFTGYALEDLYQEVALIAFYFHWSLGDILCLEHAERRRWVAHIRKLAAVK
ncbi:hypothetical protein NG798_00395 [Ancylothrix sp. C2]|uniref:DUF6760 family protein n=1 Tax=Ancylothrix sp. D3o TaxID=2953691 RepID=UPI0021BAC34A|nr:DUF6760 family protein [Ancylothrix sp. D3o]MCT7948251.1 hypothetical protein [Ancylothrix sp. D3o]